MNHVFSKKDTLAICKIPQRSIEEEIRISLWFTWFTSRIAFISGKEFDIDKQVFFDDFVTPVLKNCQINSDFRSPFKFHNRRLILA